MGVGGDKMGVGGLLVGAGGGSREISRERAVGGFPAGAHPAPLQARLVSENVFERRSLRPDRRKEGQRGEQTGNDRRSHEERKRGLGVAPARGSLPLHGFQANARGRPGPNGFAA